MLSSGRTVAARRMFVLGSKQHQWPVWVNYGITPEYTVSPISSDYVPTAVSMLKGVLINRDGEKDANASQECLEMSCKQHKANGVIVNSGVFLVCSQKPVFASIKRTKTSRGWPCYWTWHLTEDSFLRKNKGGRHQASQENMFGQRKGVGRLARERPSNGCTR